MNEKSVQQQEQNRTNIVKGLNDIFAKGRGFSILFFGGGRGCGARSPVKAYDNRRTSEADFAVK
ncbi:hypothetical protein [Geosporobacter ferrireducens]|uniref:Uncharacterized protein n=1 Tax=Geosporobacter ferrireducens TaxID=1424294 RepID=A0A1D8GEE7_9FIRM|nr:hypothetical protein [Geosporobacter ferrireducens]AOT69275.1 hypothetical protein Gferi_06655 [Geosporobacter ferrireducens]MTI56958.1 hypothetical protein [Geosporobacter ferrireducens]